MFRLMLMAVASLMLGGCATVTRGTTNDVQIMSEPGGASVRTSLHQTCTTPCTIKVSRKDEFAIVFSKPGFRDQTVEVKTQLAGAGAAGFAGNILVGGVVGMGVDAFTGSTLEHVPNPVRAVLQRVGPPPPQGKPQRGRKPVATARAPKVEAPDVDLPEAPEPTAPAT